MVSNQRILIFDPVPLWREQHAISIELAISKKKSGNQVFYAYCLGDLEYCPANNNAVQFICVQCNKQIHRSSKILRDLKISLLPTILNKSNIDEPNFINLDDFYKFKFNNLPVGELALSQLVDDTFDIYFEYEKVSKILDSYAKTAISLYEWGINTIERLNIDEVYTWNGRRHSDGPILYAAEKKNKKYFSYISGSKPRTYHVINSKKVHSINKGLKDFFEFKEFTDISMMYSEVKKNFEKQRKGKIKTFGFEKFHKSKSIKFDTSNFSNPVVTFFTSSPFEIAYMQEYFTGKDEFDDLFLFLEKLNAFSDLLDKTIIVKWHPNLIKSGEGLKLKIEDAINRFSNLIHLKPESNIDSFDLVEKSNLIITMGSSMGLYSVLLKKPTIHIGRSVYTELNIAPNPKNLDDFYELLSSEDLPINSQLATKYLFYLFNFGNRKYKYLFHIFKGLYIFKYRFISFAWSRILLVMILKK